jgi:hypothetical protein
MEIGMKKTETRRTEQYAWAFLTIFAVIEFIVLPSLPLGKYGGGIAMMVGSVIGLVVYPILFTILFKQRLRGAGFVAALAIVVGVVCTAMAAFLIRWR